MQKHRNSKKECHYCSKSLCDIKTFSKWTLSGFPEFATKSNFKILNETTEAIEKATPFRFGAITWYKLYPEQMPLRTSKARLAYTHTAVIPITMSLFVRGGSLAFEVCFSLKANAFAVVESSSRENPLWGITSIISAKSICCHMTFSVTERRNMILKR